LPGKDEISSEDWMVRRAAFAKLIGIDAETYVRRGLPFTAPVVRNTIEKDPANRNIRSLGLIELLVKENAVVEAKAQERIAKGLVDLNEGDRLSADYVNYYGDLIAAVVTLGDVKVAEFSCRRDHDRKYGNASASGVRKAAIDPVSRLLQSNDARARAAAARTLSQMVTTGAAAKDPSSRLKIKASLIIAARDNDAFVRREAVDGLVQVGDSECIALVERIARTDPYRASFLDGRYVVREAAMKALQSRSK
jgi:hypothetical protein